MPLVSLCIPTYNGSATLARCIESALAQTFQDFEIVVNDDGSTDRTAEIVRSFALRDSRIRFHANDRNLGLVANWNRTIDLAAGSWIKLLFQDDTLHRECLQELLAIGEGKRRAFVACFRNVAFGDGIQPDTRTWFEHHAAFVDSIFRVPFLEPDDIAEICLEHFAVNFVGEPIVTLLHRQVFEQVGHFDPAIAQRVDAEFWCRAGLRHGIAMVRRPLATFHFHQGSTSSLNLARRRYVDEQLDPLVILCRYLGDEAYAPVRLLARDRGIWDSMERRFADAAERARATAEEAVPGQVPSNREEWRRVVAAYPAIAVERRVSR